MTQDEKVIDFYTSQKLSEMQVADRLAISANRVRRILDKHHVERRSRSEAVRYVYITKFHKKPFVLKSAQTTDQLLLKNAGVMLYWGEGAKRGNSVAFSNSDPDMITVFLRFLRDICGIDESRLRVTVHYYEDLDIRFLSKYWSTVTGIPREQFYKPYLHRKTKGTYRAKSKYGTICVQYSDKELLRHINGWIDEFRLQFDPLKL